MSRAAWLAASLLAAVSLPSAAHESRPGLLELREGAPGAYALTWKKPAGGEVDIRIAPVFPQECRLAAPGQSRITPGAVLVRGMLACEGGIRGRTVAIDGLEATLSDVLLRVHHADGWLESHVLRPASPSVRLGERTAAWQRYAGYFGIGIEHIALGADHLLFVLGLLLIVRDRWMLVKTVTAFTVAHSITLAMATLGYARVPVPPLEATIALSILFLGPEIVRTWRGESSFTLRHPWVVAFAFGLLHGFGFASALASLGIPAHEIAPALLFFNLGVEAGQLAFVAIALGLGYALRRALAALPRAVAMAPGYLVGSLGAYWMIQRTAAML